MGPALLSVWLMLAVLNVCRVCEEYQRECVCVCVCVRDCVSACFRACGRAYFVFVYVSQRVRVCSPVPVTYVLQ